MADICTRCKQPVGIERVTLISVYVGKKVFHYDCIRETDTIRTLREA